MEFLIDSPTILAVTDSLSHRKPCRGAALLRPMPARSLRLEPVAWKFARMRNCLDLPHVKMEGYPNPRSRNENLEYKTTLQSSSCSYSRSQAALQRKNHSPAPPPSTSKANGPSPPKIPKAPSTPNTSSSKQNGNEITGHFKGPNQSGGLQGTVNDHHIFFRTKTRQPLGFRGQVNGDTIEGTFHTRRGTGQFHAVREPHQPQLSLIDVL